MYIFIINTFHAPIGAWKCNVTAFEDFMTDQTIELTDRPMNMRSRN